MTRSPPTELPGIVSVSSSGHGNCPVVFDDLCFDRRPYDPGPAYGQSTTAQVLFAVEATHRWAGDEITANALLPGGIWTNLQRHWDPAELAATKASTAAAGWTAKTVGQGAATSVLLATYPAGRDRRPLLRGLPRGRGRFPDHRRTVQGMRLRPQPRHSHPPVGRFSRAARPAAGVTGVQ